MQYAKNTSVSIDRSKIEVEYILKRYGAEQFISGWDQENSYIGFRMLDRQIRFVIPMPQMDEFKTTETGRARTKSSTITVYEQACKQRWRAFALVIKAKLEAVESGISEFEDEFLAHIMLPNGRTVGEFMRPQIAVAYDKGAMPKLLPFEASK